MKLLILTLLFTLSLTSFSQSLPNPLPNIKGKSILKFIARTKSLRDLSLYKVMKTRCDRYSHQPSECKRSISKLIIALDFDMEILDNDQDQTQQDGQTSDTSNPWEIQKFVFAAFKDILLQLLDTPKITTYLNGVNNGLGQDIETLKSFNLWEYTLNFFKRDRYIASAVIATLFQDTSMATTHLEYIRHRYKNLNKTATTNLDALSEAIVKIAILEEDHPKLSKKIIFPRTINSMYITSIYHFFVPYFLVQKLMKEDHLRVFSAKEASLMLTLTYEFASTTTDYKHLFKDPQTLNLKKNQNKLQDIYTGYIAANYAVDQVYLTTSFPELATAFSFSTYDAVTNYVLLR